MNLRSTSEASAAPEAATSKGASPTKARVAESTGVACEALVVKIAADIAARKRAVGILPSRTVVLLPSAVGGTAVGVPVAPGKDIVVSEMRGITGEGIA